MHQRRVFYYATDDYGYAHAHSAAAVAANYSRGYHTHDNGPTPQVGRLGRSCSACSDRLRSSMLLIGMAWRRHLELLKPRG
jgi:hypothetical protein